MSKELNLSPFVGDLEEVAAHVQRLIEKHGKDARLNWSLSTTGWGQHKIVPSLFQPQRLITLDELKEMFPRKAGTCSKTGYIPMEFVNENLTMLAKIVKDNNLRRIYRGPRQPGSVMTLRDDAYAMVLYSK